MPVGEVLSTLARPLISVGKALAPVVRQLRAERQGGADSRNVNTALLDAQLEETLNRLENIDGHDSWWGELLQRAETSYVRPEYLAKPSVRDWLREAAVRDDLKTLARATLLPGLVDEAVIRARLTQRYSHHTGEISQLATGPIEAIINILAAGAFAQGSKGDLMVAGLVQESHKGISAQLESIEGKLVALSPDVIVTQVITEKAQAALDLILLRRSIPGVNARVEIAALAARLENEGDLRFCARLVQAQIYLWAARLHAQSKDKVEAARAYRAKAVSLDANAGTEIVDAWLSANSGDVAGGLGQSRDINTSDGRSNLLLMLSLHHGRERALEWFDANRPGDTDFLTAFGWKNAATLLAEAGRFEDAAARLEALPDKMIAECPDIPYVEGVINAALTLPAWLRRFALTMQIIERQVETLQGAEIAARHRRALRSFERAKELLSGLGEKVRVAGAETWRTWLLLTEPSSRQEGERIVIDAMREGATAIDYAQLAYTFGIPFDTAPLERHLAIRELAGGLSPPEVAAKLALYRHARSKAQIVSFLEQERANLSSVVPPAGYWFLLVTTLVEAGQMERAEQILSDKRDEFGEDFERLQDQIRLRRGEDVLKSFEDRFLETDADIDLLTLCDNLRNSEDHEKVRRYNLELFKRQRNRRSAHRVCAALIQMEHHQEVVDFLSAADDLVTGDNDLSMLKAWSLFEIGGLAEAKLINDRLRQIRHDPNDAHLELNLAVAMGTWEKFSEILICEWADRDKREPKYLLQLAQLAADIDKDRAIELVREATRKAPDSPELLAAASILAYRLGRDDEAMPLMVEAARLSPPENGPVRTGGIREAVDIAIAGADTTRGVEEAFSAARIPLHTAAPFLKMPMTRLLVSQARNNERERDARLRTVIPIRHGVRGILEMSPVRTIIADITSLVLLAELDLLPIVKERFNRIAIPWSTMELLLAESHTCRFHQPSRIAGAKKLRELITSNTLRPFASSGDPPSQLVEEVGPDLAELLYAAKQFGGRVIRPLPIHRIQTFMEQEARLGEYAPLVMTTLQLLDVLDADAILDRPTVDRARRMLTSLEQREALGTNKPGGGPIYLDGLAVAYLSGAGLLDHLSRSAREFRIHPTTITEIDQLIHTEGEADRTIEVLSRLRIWLRDGIATGLVTVMPRSRPPEDEDNMGLQTRVLQELVSDIGTADAVLIDDRMAGALGRVTDRSSHAAPIIDTLDLLNEFTRSGLLSSQDRFHGHHVLRARGFICIPVELEEIQGYLATAEPDPDTGLLRENAELRVIRENLQRLRSTTIVQQPAETVYLDRIRITGFLALRRLWADALVPIPTARARTEWLWHTLMLTPIDWAHTIVDPAGVVAPTTGLLNVLSGLLLTIPNNDLERARAFRDWIDAEVLAPLERVSSESLDELARITITRLRGLVDERAVEH
jgi:tetratricopeptide (TPR) repeat protein